MQLTNIFLKKLKALATKQSPTFLRLIEMKRMSDSGENAMNPDYLRGAFSVLSEYYIQGIDSNEIRFGSDYEEHQFMWMLQLMVDYACDGKMEELVEIDPRIKVKIIDLMAAAKQE